MVKPDELRAILAVLREMRVQRFEDNGVVIVLEPEPLSFDHVALTGDEKAGEEEVAKAVRDAEDDLFFSSRS